MKMDKSTMKMFEDGINTAIPNKSNKEIIGAVLSVVYEDGKIEERAIMTDGDISWQLDIISNIMKSCTFALTSCLSCVPTGLKKLGGMLE